MNDWVLIGKVDEPDKKDNGYTILKEDTICCADCGAKLVDVIIVHESKIPRIVKVKCPCGGESFIYTVDGEAYFQATPQYIITDIPTEFKDNKCYMTIEVTHE